MWPLPAWRQWQLATESKYHSPFLTTIIRYVNLYLFERYKSAMVKLLVDRDFPPLNKVKTIIHVAKRGVTDQTTQGCHSTSPAMQPASRRLCTLSIYQSLCCRNSAGIPYFTRTSSCLPTIPSRSRRPYSSQVTDIVFPDPNRSDLFYHVVNPPTPLSKSLPAFAISFLHQSPPRVDSSTVLGWLPAETYMTDSPDTPAMDHAHQNKETSAGLRDFVGNREYHLQLRGILEVDTQIP